MDAKTRGRRAAARRITVLSACLGASLSVLTAPAAAAETPNVMVVIADDQRDDQMGSMDFTRSFFGGGGTEFTSGYVTTGLCCPSRSTIMSGLYAHNHRVVRNDVARRFPHETSIQRELSRAGYVNGIFGKFLNNWPADRDPPHFDVSKLGYGDSQRLADRRTGVNVRGFLEAREADDDRPWLAIYSARAPHTPLEPLRRFEDAAVSPFAPRDSFLEKDLTDKPAVITSKSRSRRRLLNQPSHFRRGERMLLGLDEQIGKTMGTLDELGETSNTLLFYISDNGYFLGEHRQIRKGPPYREGIEVPLYMRWDGQVTAGAIDTRLAANVDLAPTIYEAAGIEPGYEVDGHSLLGEIRRPYALAEYDDHPWHWAQVFDETGRYIETYDRDGKRIFREFYDLGSDPAELENLFTARRGFAADPRAVEAAKRLASVRRCAGAACP